MSQLDFDAIKDQLRLQTVLDWIGWQPARKTGHQRRGPCPIHRSRTAKSVIFAVRFERWYCHHCKRGGDALELWAAWAGLPIFRAALYACKRLGIRPPWRPQMPDVLAVDLDVYSAPAPRNGEGERLGGRGVSPRSSPDRGEAPPG